MTRIIFFSIAMLAIILMSVAPAFAKRAEVLLLPTRITMEDKDRYATLRVKNTGDATGNFSVDPVDMKMIEQGAVVGLEEGETEPYSALKMLRISPRSMTLAPGEVQNVRVLLRKPEGLEDGEYRAHLRVRVDDDNVETEPEEGKTAEVELKTEASKSKKDTAVAVRANLVLVIPVIVRHGETSYRMAIGEPKLSQNAEGKPQLEMYLAREGTRSSMGDIKVTHISAKGEERVLTFFPGVPVYRPTPRRFIAVPLEVPEGTDLSVGKLHITYSAQEKEDNALLAETTLTLP